MSDTPGLPLFSVIQFPGSLDDRDMRFALDGVLKASAQLVWHKETQLPADTRGVVLPGGFSYGDYLRCGAMAKYSPVMAAVKRFADAGGPVLGVCNGFQVLCEAGLLPGALLRNRNLHFGCAFVHLRVERARAPFTSRAIVGQVLRIPIKNGEGAYYAASDELARIEANGQVVLRYCDANGVVDEASNPNGSLANIAGVSNPRGNVLGLMPHPEHAVEPGIGGTDGRVLLGSLIDAVRGAERAR
ncbi:MAG TPA: phosphoribosylformylglycinamidine synthase subunit PurQ [Myxococcota bacterium]|nr:phosphoribosylformylglycinamidine synthase subunit PurQ [Myxococcota bacterium]